MSDDTKPAKKPGKKKKLLIGIVALALLGGGGVGAGLYARSAGLIGGGAAEDVDRPQLVPRDGVSASEAARSAKAGGKPDPTKFKVTYYPIEDNFTVNLRDGEGFVQVAIGVSTYYDERVIQHITLHEMAVRSAVLMTLSDQDSLSMPTPAGKSALRQELKKAINAVLVAKEGFGGVDDVYFTSFVIQ